MVVATVEHKYDQTLSPMPLLSPLAPSPTLLPTEVELFPLCLAVYSCDISGRANRTNGKEFLFSHTCTIADVATELCDVASANINPNNVRIWDTVDSSFKDEYVLTPAMVLSDTNLKDGSTILMEVRPPIPPIPPYISYTSLYSENTVLDPLNHPLSPTHSHPPTLIPSQTIADVSP